MQIGFGIGFGFLIGNVCPATQRFTPFLGLLRHDLLHEITSNQASTGFCLGDQALIVEILRRENPLHRSLSTNAADEGSCVDASDANNSVLLQIFVKTAFRSKVAVNATQFADDKTRQMWPAAFDILFVDAVVANLGISHRDNLPSITWVGEDFLITRHRGVEANFPFNFTRSSKACAGVDRSILKRQLCCLFHGSQTCRLIDLIFGFVPRRLQRSQVPFDRHTLVTSVSHLKSKPLSPR